jgi:hypothetical protein
MRVKRDLEYAYAGAGKQTATAVNSTTARQLVSFAAQIAQRRQWPGLPQDESTIGQ